MRFPVNIAKFLRTHILKNICERLLLIGIFENLNVLLNFGKYLITLTFDCFVLLNNQLIDRPVQKLKICLFRLHVRSRGEFPC